MSQTLEILFKLESKFKARYESYKLMKGGYYYSAKAWKRAFLDVRKEIRKEMKKEAVNTAQERFLDG